MVLPPSPSSRGSFRPGRRRGSLFLSFPWYIFIVLFFSLQRTTSTTEMQGVRGNNADEEVEGGRAVASPRLGRYSGRLRRLRAPAIDRRKRAEEEEEEEDALTDPSPVALVGLLEIKAETTSTDTAGGEEGEAPPDPCAEDKDPNCIHFHTNYLGKRTQVAKEPVHMKEFIADRTGRTELEKARSNAFMKGVPDNTFGSSWVMPCSNYPYCLETPAPPPNVPPPWQMLANPVPHVYPALGEPHAPLPWRVDQKQEWLSRQPKSVQDKAEKMRIKYEKEVNKKKKKMLPGFNPERLDLQQHPVSYRDMIFWKGSYITKENYDGKVQYKAS